MWRERKRHGATSDGAAIVVPSNFLGSPGKPGQKPEPRRSAGASCPPSSAIIAAAAVCLARCPSVAVAACVRRTADRSIDRWTGAGQVRRRRGGVGKASPHPALFYRSRLRHVRCLRACISLHLCCCAIATATARHMHVCCCCCCISYQFPRNEMQ